MEFGLQVGGMPVTSLRELAALADERGFRYLTVPDHFVLEEPGSGLDVTKPSLEAIAVLGRSRRRRRARSSAAWCSATCSAIPH